MRINIHIEDAMLEDLVRVANALSDTSSVVELPTVEQMELPFAPEASRASEGVETPEEPPKAEEEPPKAKKKPAKKSTAKKKAPTKKTETKEELLEKAVELATELLANGKKARVKKALDAAGAKKVRELEDEDKLREFLAVLEA